ncbi:M20 family metallopeptidase [Roseomonas populi]|uniref:M20 family metallopeptidase n=1 Tax=Roseomonas populi TaxID=3121582 RepID=A0ABT1X2C9_9PROT|nr:M20 family metallopeptidase [Roseomonas pecuniae]MCR0982265.1 M20 family metallopeptidase [Roseomonas pecuniae]
MRNDEFVWRAVDERKEDYAAFSDRVWDMPEIAYTETRSVAEHVAMLEKEGARITRDLAGIPTAVMGEWGEGGPVIAILGEYDALPNLSQEAGIAEHKEVVANGPGHGCGHNLLGAASLLAAAAVKDWLKENNIPGRVRYYGCPAEEGGAAKGFMARDGVFDDVDIAISWHPASFSGVNDPVSLANTRIDFTFHGKSSHAAAAPELGRSALDAVELMNVGVNYMREHMPDHARIHYAMLDGGGIAPNVVQSRAKVRYLIRARDLPELNMLVGRVRKIADGAALMTETRVETSVVSAVSNLLGNTPLEKAMYDNFQRLGPPQFDDKDREYAAQIQATLTEQDIQNAHRRHGLKVEPGKVLCDIVVPLESKGDGGGVGSTDVGDVSWAVPTVQARGATCAIGTPFHSWQLTAQGKSPHAHKGVVHVAKVMAGTAVDAIRDPSLVEKAKAEFKERTGGKPYESPLPKDLAPPIKAMGQGV